MRKSNERYSIEFYIEVHPEADNDEIMTFMEECYHVSRMRTSDIISKIKKKES